MKDIFKEVLSEYVADWQNNILGFGFYENNKPLASPKIFIYYFKVLNGAFKEETKTFKFKYFRELDKSELVKFVFRSLSDVKSNYIFTKNKFHKVFLCY